MEEILNIVNEHNVTFINNINNKQIQTLIKTLYAQQKPRILFTALHKESLMCLQAQLKHEKIKSQMILENDSTINSKIFLMDAETLYHYYVRLENRNMADIIIFYDSEVYNDYYHLLWQIWQKYEEKEQRLPRLILIEEEYQSETVPFTRSKDNTYVFAKRKRKLEIKYGTNDLSLTNIIDKIDFKLEGQQLLLVPDKRLFFSALKLIREKDKNFPVYTFDENIYQHDKNKIFTPVSKNRLLISTHNCALFLALEKLVAIYDNCKTSKDFYGNRQIFNISQKTGRHIAKEASKLVYRALDESMFKELNLVESMDTPIDKKAKIVLLAYKMEHDIKISKENTLIEHLERLDFIRAGKVHQSASRWLSLELSLPATAFIREWHCKNLPLFPGLILATLISDCKNSLLFIPPTEENPNSFIKTNYKGIRDDNILIFYLNIFLTFMKDKKDLDLEKADIQLWCQEYYIHAQTFYYLITKLKKVVERSRKIENFELGLFESKNVFVKAKPLIAQTYTDHIYDSHDKVEHIYHNRLGGSAVLDKKRFNSGYFFFPEKFISFYKLNNVRGHDIILFYMILED